MPFLVLQHFMERSYLYHRQVIGAGVVGLSVAEQLVRQAHGRRLTTLLVDKWPRFGMETSSRSSEVIHAGIYYEPDSLKTRLCIRGKRMLYQVCERAGIPHARIGKWIVAVTPDQVCDLERIHAKSNALGVPTRFVDRATASRLEPHVRAHAVLESPSTGIIDSHAYMQYLESSFVDGGGITAYRTTVVAVERRGQSGGGFRVTLAHADHDGATTRSGSQSALATTTTVVETDVLVIAAGLSSTDIARMILSADKTEHLKMHYCKGYYLSYLPSRPLASRLIYPIPEKNLVGLGIHCTLDLSGRMRFGPDTKYVDRPDDYGIRPDEVDALVDTFHRSIVRYMPGVRACDLVPDYTGIRPKLSGRGERARDFVVEGHGDGLVVLAGIESPGLTASGALGELVAQHILFGSRLA